MTKYIYILILILTSCWHTQLCGWLLQH